MTQMHKSDKRLLFISLGLDVLVYLIDLVTPLGIAIGMFYLTVMRIAAMASVWQVPVLTGAVSSVLLFLGFFFGTAAPSGFPVWIAVANRTLNLIIIWLAVSLALLAQRRQRRQQTECKVAELLVGSPLPEEAIRQVLAVLAEGLEWEWGALWLVDREAQVLRCSHSCYAASSRLGELTALSQQSHLAPGAEGPGRAWTTGKACWISDLTRDCATHRATVAVASGLRGNLAVPVLDGAHVVGVLEFFSRRPVSPDAETLRTWTQVGQYVGSFLHRSQKMGI